MKWMKDFFIQQKLSKKRTKPGNKRWVKFDQVTNITILSENEEMSTIAQKTVAGIWDHPLNITFVYREKNPAYECYDYEDFNLLAKPKEKIRDILSKPTDLVLVTHPWMDPLTTHFLNLMDTVYSLGFYNPEHEKHLDLMLARTEEDLLEQNLENLIKYFKKIN